MYLLLLIIETIHEILVSWSTRLPSNQSIVIYNSSNYQFKSYGEEKYFMDGGPLKSVQYFHKVKLSNLRPGTRYEYICGSDLGWSKRFYFKTIPDINQQNESQHNTWIPQLAIFGDMGLENAQSLPLLQQDIQRDMYDAIIHVGDLAYDLDTNNAQIGDAFMKQLETVAAYVPYMVVPGNHEEK